LRVAFGEKPEIDRRKRGCYAEVDVKSPPPLIIKLGLLSCEVGICFTVVFAFSEKAPPTTGPSTVPEPQATKDGQWNPQSYK
jgi:hypothetical protein